MPVYTLDRTQTVDLPIGECWAFFSDPRNLSKITPPDLGFEVVSDLPATIHPGLMIEYRVRPLFGIPLTWLTEITHVDHERSFVDEQRVGPYRVWHHRHTFAELADGRTECRDLVHYVPPFGPLGALIHPILIRPNLDRIFEFRASRVRNL